MKIRFVKLRANDLCLFLVAWCLTGYFKIYIILSIFLAIAIGFPLLSNAQQGVTKHGESASSTSGFINEKGRGTNYPAVTKYGEILFPCTQAITDSRDGNVYQIVRIGNQCWLAENLRYLPSVVGPGTSASGIPYYYVYNYNGTDVMAAKATPEYITYGALYNFWAATGGFFQGSSSNPSGIQGACPSGWHLPSDSEWQQLSNYLSNDPLYWCDGTAENIAKSLASTSGWQNSAVVCEVGNDQISNNITGFNGLPGGYFYPSTFENMGFRSSWWSATTLFTSAAWFRFLHYNIKYLSISALSKSWAASVRCIRDDCDYLPPPVSGTHITSTNQIEWHWNAVPFATGYKYNTSNDYNTAIDIGNATSFIQSVTNGTCGEFTLYVWAYSNCALSSVGILKEYNYLTDSRDGQQYTTVQIGNQCWMKDNLKYLPSVVGPATGSESVAYRYVYDYNGTNVATAKATANYSSFGVLYNWTAAMNGTASSSSNPSGVQGACPSGWHLPSDAEFTQLTDYLSANGTYWCAGVSTQIAKSLANTSGWTNSGTTCAVGNAQTFNNTSGFTALPSGYRTFAGTFSGLNDLAYFYSTTAFSATHAWNRRLFWNNTGVDRWPESKSNAFSVRCIRN